MTANASIALLQMSCNASRDANLQHASDMAGEAAQRGATVICLPELFLGPYPCQTEDAARFAEAEPIPGPTTAALQELAQRLQVVLIASLFERRAAGLYYNTCVTLDADGQLCGKYRKMHIPDDPLYYEKFYFTPGDLGYRAFPTRAGTIGTLICWDQWFPEAARLTAMQGAELLVYPTAIGWHPSERQSEGHAQLDSWITVQRSHAIANGCFVAAVNRVGHEGAEDGGIDFWGHSFVCHPSGEILVQGDQQEAILMAEIDLREVERQRTHWPFFRDRRVDSYAELTQQFGRE
ncbi:MAG: carbon-nitrogen hydrolase [Planctomycetota bacterium]